MPNMNVHSVSFSIGVFDKQLEEKGRQRDIDDECVHPAKRFYGLMRLIGLRRSR